MALAEVIGQVFGILATIISFFSYQMNTKKSLLIAQTAATFCTCLSYYLLGATSGFVLNIVCIIRNIAFYFIKERKALYASIAFAMIMCVLGGLSWQGYLSLLIIIPLAVNTVFLSLGRPQLLRYSILFTSTTIMIYNIFIFSIGGITNEAIAIVSAFIGILRFGAKKDLHNSSEEESREDVVL